MKLARIVAALVAFVFVLGALPEISLASPAQSQVSSQHQARRGKRHKKRARRHRRKHSKAKSGMEF